MVSNFFEQFLSEATDRLAFLAERYGYARTSEVSESLLSSEEKQERDKVGHPSVGAGLLD